MPKKDEGLTSIEDDEDFEVTLDEDDEEEPENKDEDSEDEDDQEADEEDSTDEEDESEDGDPDGGKPQGYGKRAQKRIRNLVKQRSAAQRETEVLKQQLEEFKAKLEKQTTSSGRTQDFAFTQFEERVSAQEAALKTAWESAYEDGDKDKLFEINQNMSRVALDRARLDEWKARNDAGGNQADDDDGDGGQDDKGQVQQPQVAPRLQKWLNKNSWFRSNEDMTLDALQIDEDLREDGVEVGSEEYFNEVDKRMRELYPSKFKKPKPKASSAGARGGGAAKRKTTKVKLSASERATADRMGIKYEDYAREKAKLEAE